MSYILDGIALGVIAVFAIHNYRKGFVKTAVMFFGFLIAAFLAKALAAPVSEFIYNTFVEKSVSAAISAKTEAVGAGATASVNQFIEGLPGIFRNCINLSGTDIGGVVDGKANEIGAYVQTNIAAPAITAFINTIVFIILFVVLGFALRILSRFMGFFNKIPLVGPVNKFLGGLVGALEGIIIVFLAAAVIHLILALSGEKFPIKPADIEESYIFKVFYNFNVGSLIKKG